MSRFGLEELRINCLCAQCRGLREQGLDAWPGEGAPGVLRIETAREVGNWGLNFFFNDWETTVIYTWEIRGGWDEDREDRERGSVPE